MNLDLFWRYAPSLLSGFGVTILCWAAGGALGLILGFAITLLRRLRIMPLNWLIRAFIEMFRGTPFLVQLFLLYAGGPSIGLRLSATAAGILGLGLYSSAYFAEIFRAGFAAVPVGQIEAAASVGMTPFDTMIRVMLPGALTLSPHVRETRSPAFPPGSPSATPLRPEANRRSPWRRSRRTP